MRKNVTRVLAAMLNGTPAKGERSRFNGKRIVSTDGDTLYSYGMPVAQIVRRPVTRGAFRKGVVEIIEYGRAPTATTRSHVSAARYVFKHEVASDYVIRWVQYVPGECD